MARRIVVVGCGGIADHLLHCLMMMLGQPNRDPYEVVLVDGDTFDETNRARQTFKRLGPKAYVRREELGEIYPHVAIDAFPFFLSDRPDQLKLPTVKHPSEIIMEGDEIFLCVDNLDARRAISLVAERLNNVLIIDGGNELTTGLVTYHLRKNGVDISPPATKFRADVANAKPRDYTPGCTDMMEKNPQLAITNMGVAVDMLRVWHAHHRHMQVAHQVYSSLHEPVRGQVDFHGPAVRSSCYVS